MFGERNAATDQADAFAFEKTSLEAGERFAHGNPAAGGENAMPRYGSALGAGGHRAARGTSSARQARGLGQSSVGQDAALGNAFDQDVDASPAFGHAGKITSRTVICQSCHFTKHNRQKKS